MEVKNTPGPYRYQMTFVGEEVEAVGAAYREHVYELAKKSNSGSISEHDVWVADSWDDCGKPMSIRSNHPENDILEVLDHFVERTDEAIVAMPELSGSAPYMSTDIPHRCHLGNIARRLVEEIREETTIVDFSNSLEEDLGSIVDEQAQ